MENKRHKHADLIIAWAEGAEIEKEVKSGDWVLISLPSWDNHANYRIKSSEPDYIPFETVDEVIEVFGTYIISKDKTKAQMIMMAEINKADTLTINGILTEYLLEHYTFIDGNPFGKLKQ